MYEPSLLSGVPTANIPWIFGAVLVGGWLFLYFLSWVVQWSLAWVDDTKTSGANKFFTLTMRVFGYKQDSVRNYIYTEALLIGTIP